MSPEKTTNAQVEAELRAQIDASRDRFMKTLESLVHEVQPQTQVAHLSDDVKFAAEETKFKVQTTLDDAREGDPDAVKKVLIAAAVGVGIVGLLVLRHKLRS